MHFWLGTFFAQITSKSDILQVKNLLGSPCIQYTCSVDVLDMLQAKRCRKLCTELDNYHLGAFKKISFLPD